MCQSDSISLVEFTQRQGCEKRPGVLTGLKRFWPISCSAAMHTAVVLMAFFLVAGGRQNGSGSLGGGQPGSTGDVYAVLGSMTLGPPTHETAVSPALDKVAETRPSEPPSEPQAKSEVLKKVSELQPTASTDSTSAVIKTDKNTRKASPATQATEAAQKVKKTPRAESILTDPTPNKKNNRASSAPESLDQSDVLGDTSTTGQQTEFPGEGVGDGQVAGTGGGVDGSSIPGPGILEKPDYPPRVLSRTSVVYPTQARKQHITGHVLLRFHVDEKGHLSRVHVLKATPAGVFEKAAIASVSRWRFAPAMKDGKPVPSWVELPMPFLLTK